MMSPHFDCLVSRVTCWFDTQGKYSDADALFMRVQDTLEKAPGGDNPDLATTLNLRSNVLSAQVKYWNTH